MSQTICSKCTVIVDEIYSVIIKYQNKQQLIIQNHKNKSKQLEAAENTKSTENQNPDFVENVKKENSVCETSKTGDNSLLNEVIPDSEFAVEYYWRSKLICLFCDKYFVTQPHMDKHLERHSSLIKSCEDLSTPCFVGLQRLPFKYENNEKKVNYYINPLWIHFDEKTVVRYDVNRKYHYRLRERNLRRRRKRMLESENEGDYSSDVSSQLNYKDNNNVRKEQNQPSKICKLGSQLNVHTQEIDAVQEKAPISSQQDISTNQNNDENKSQDDVKNKSQDDVKNKSQDDVRNTHQDDVGNIALDDVIMLDDVDMNSSVSLKLCTGPASERNKINIAIGNVVVNGSLTSNSGHKSRQQIEKQYEIGKSSDMKIFLDQVEICNEVKHRYKSEQNKKAILVNSKAKLFYDMLESKDVIDVVWVPTLDDVVKKSPNLSLRNVSDKKNLKKDSLLKNSLMSKTNKSSNNNAMVMLPDKSNSNYSVSTVDIPSGLGSTAEQQRENTNIIEEPSTSAFSPKIVSSFTLQCNGLQSNYSSGSPNSDQNKTMKSKVNTSNEKSVKIIENVNSSFSKVLNNSVQKSSETGSLKSNANNALKETMLSEKLETAVIKPLIKCKPTELLMPNNQQSKVTIEKSLSDVRLNDPNNQMCVSNNQTKLIFPPPLTPIQLQQNVTYSVPISVDFSDVSSSIETDNTILCPTTISKEALHKVAGNNMFNIHENTFTIVQNPVPKHDINDIFLSTVKRLLRVREISLQQLSTYKDKNVLMQNSFSMSHLLHLLVRFKITMNIVPNDRQKDKNYFVNLYIDNEGVLVLNCVNSNNLSENIELWPNGFQKQLFKAFGDKCIGDIITKAATQFTLFLEKVLGFLSVIKTLLKDDI